MSTNQPPSPELQCLVIIFALDNSRPWIRRSQAKLAATSILRSNPGVRVQIIRNAPKPCFLVPRREVVEKLVKPPTPDSRSFPSWCITERLRSLEIGQPDLAGIDRVILLDADTLILGDISAILAEEKLVVGKPSDRLAFNREFYGKYPFSEEDLDAHLPLPEDAATTWFFGGPTEMVKEFLEHWYRVTHRLARCGYTRPDRGALNVLLKTGKFPWKHLDSKDFREAHQLPRNQHPQKLKAVHFGGQNDGMYGGEFDQGGTHCMNKLRAMFALWQEAFQFTPEMHILDWLET